MSYKFSRASDIFHVAAGLDDTAATNNNLQEAKLLFWDQTTQLCQDIVNKDILETVTNISKNTLTF